MVFRFAARLLSGGDKHILNNANSSVTVLTRRFDVTNPSCFSVDPAVRADPNAANHSSAVSAWLSGHE